MYFIDSEGLSFLILTSSQYVKPISQTFNYIYLKINCILIQEREFTIFKTIPAFEKAILHTSLSEVTPIYFYRNLNPNARESFQTIINITSKWPICRTRSPLCLLNPNKAARLTLRFY